MSCNISFPFQVNSSLVISCDVNKDHNYEYPVQEVTENIINTIGSPDELKQVLMEYALKKMHFAEPESVEYVRYKILESILSNEEIDNITGLQKAYKMVIDLSINTLNKIFDNREFFYSCFSTMDGAQISDFIDDYLLVFNKEDFFSLNSLLDQFFVVTRFTLPEESKIGVYQGLSNFAVRIRRWLSNSRRVEHDESRLEQAIEERLGSFSREEEITLYKVLQKEELLLDFNGEESFSIEGSLVFTFFVPDPYIAMSKTISISHMIRISTLLCSLERKHKNQFDDKLMIFRLLASALLEHECDECVQNSLSINLEDSYSSILSKCFGIKICLDGGIESLKPDFVLKDYLSTLVELKLRLAQSLGGHCASDIIRSINFTSDLLRQIHHEFIDKSLSAHEFIELLTSSNQISSLAFNLDSKIQYSLILDALKYSKPGNDHYNRLPALMNDFHARYPEDFYSTITNLFDDLEAQQRSIVLTAIDSTTLDLHPWMQCMPFGARTFTLQGIQKTLEKHSNVLIREQCAAIAFEELETIQWNCIGLCLKPRAYIIDHYGSHFLLLYVHKIKDRFQFIIFDSRSSLGSMRVVKERMCQVAPLNSDIICICLESLEEIGQKNRLLQLQNDGVNCSVFACETAKLFIKKPEVVAQIISAKVPSNEKRPESVSLFEVEYQKLPWQLFLTCQSMRLLKSHISLVSNESKELFMRKRDKYVGRSSNGKRVNLRIDYKSRAYEKNLFKWAMELSIKK